jgi:peptidoglycan/LPS O-acetylase OafA/YrhL
MRHRAPFVPGVDAVVGDVRVGASGVRGHFTLHYKVHAPSALGLRSGEVLVKKSLRRIRAALVMGLIWAVVWAPVAVVIGTTIVDPDDSMDEMWILVGAYPGFIGGVVFSMVLAFAARHRRFAELSMPRFAAWGAVAGLLAGALPFALGNPTSAVPLWLLACVAIGAITLLCAASAAGSLALARMAERREQLPMLGTARPDELSLGSPDRSTPVRRS